MNYEDIEVGKEYLIRVRVEQKSEDSDGYKYIFVEPIDENGADLDPEWVDCREFWENHSPAFIPCEQINTEQK